MKRFLVALMFFTAAAAGPRAHAQVWEVRKGPATVYIGGTIHMLREADYPLPPAFGAAFERADILVFETDFSTLGSQEMQLRIMELALYPEGESLDAVLSSEAYDSLRAYCAALGLPVSALHRVRPWMVVLSLLALELQKMGVAQQHGIDMFYYRRALEEGKPVAFLETVDEQIGFLLELGEGYESELIMQTVSELRVIRERMGELISCWRTGDEEQLYNLSVAELEQEYPEVYDVLLKGRNDRWLEEIENFLTTPQRELVLVGAAHLVGPDGLIDRLRERGYEVGKIE